MAIAFSKYIPITSVVGAANGVQNREFIGRLNTTNPRLPTNSVREFMSADEVKVYFGVTSEEYLRASTAYFNYISQKNLNTPQKISFARWADVATAPQIFGMRLSSTTLAQFQVITNGAFSLTLGTVTNVISGLDFTSALSLSDVAAVIQAGINAQTGGMWTAATVVYDNVFGSLDFTGGQTGDAIIRVDLAGTGTEILFLMGWGSATTTILSDGSNAQTINQFLTESTNINNNYGSFVFLPQLTVDQVTQATLWNNQPENNVLFQYYVPVTFDNYVAYSQPVIDLAGTGFVISVTDGQYPEQAPMCVFATTNYASTNAVQNYQYQQFDFLFPSVTDTTLSDVLDNNRINYYGQTQNAGQKINFFQRGVLTGNASDPIDMGVYANEQWLKDQAGVAIMSLFLQETRIPANPQGITQITAVLQDQVIKAALSNGTISIGKPLTLQQQGFITTVTGDNTAWQVVQNSGYWLKVQITPDLQASYTLIYSKDDDIRKVEGLHVLI